MSLLNKNKNFDLFIFKYRGVSQKGFTLIEVLIATLILAFGLVMVVEGMGRSQEAIRVGENLVAASLVGEKTLRLSETELLTAHTLSRTSSNGREKVTGGREFEWNKDTDSFDHESIKDRTKLNEVITTVQWREGHRENKLELATLLLNEERKKEV